MKRSNLKRKTPLKAKPFAKSSWKSGKKTLQGSGLKQRMSAIKGASLKSRSKKRASEEKIYSKLRKEYLERNPMCEAFLFGCQGTATEIHHKAKRYGKLLNMVEHWCATCSFCHRHLHDNPAEAKRMGLMYSI